MMRIATRRDGRRDYWRRVYGSSSGFFLTTTIGFTGLVTIGGCTGFTTGLATIATGFFASITGGLVSTAGGFGESVTTVVVTSAGFTIVGGGFTSIGGCFAGGTCFGG